MSTQPQRAPAAQHTAGPWTTGGTARGIYCRDQYMIASAHSMAWMTDPEKESVANAHLIAAAPDLLAALKSAVELLSEAWHIKTIESARAAIARSEGGAK